MSNEISCCSKGSACVAGPSLTVASLAVVVLGFMAMFSKNFTPKQMSQVVTFSAIGIGGCVLIAPASKASTLVSLPFFIVTLVAGIFAAKGALTQKQLAWTILGPGIALTGLGIAFCCSVIGVVGSMVCCCPENLPESIQEAMSKS